jgi:hypothetical protein
LQTWPKKTPDLETLQVTMDGLDMPFSQKDHLRRWKLEVSFCGMHTRTSEMGSLEPQLVTAHHRLRIGIKQWRFNRMGMKQPLKVAVDLCHKLCNLDKLQMYFFKWVQQRKKFDTAMF